MSPTPLSTNKKPDENPLQSVKPTARRRTALKKESRLRQKRLRQNVGAEKILQTDTPGLLQPETELEQTYQVRQSHLTPHLDLSTNAKASFHLDLSESGLSPYIKSVYSRSSRSLLTASRKGHVSLLNWRQTKLQCELYLNETIRDATFLHNDSLFALAQRHNVYIYDSTGLQLHSLQTHTEPGYLTFLPHHLLLASASAPVAPHNRLVYTDVSTGDIAAELHCQRQLGNTQAIATNPSNGVISLAHATGSVTMWSPIASKPLATIFSHRGGVKAISFAPHGRWYATAGADGLVKLWDTRIFRELAQFRIPTVPVSLAVSQRELVALAFGATVQVWQPPNGISERSKNLPVLVEKPYMMETFSGKRVTGLDFCPFEDILSVCHEQGMQSMIIPGAGEATFDTNAPHPYENRKHNRSAEVRTLLDKLPPESIGLDSNFVGGVDPNPTARLKEIRDRQMEANQQKVKKAMEKNRAKGRNKISKKLRRKQQNIIDAKKLEMQQKLEEHKRIKEAARKLREKESNQTEGDELPSALDRFRPKE